MSALAELCSFLTGFAGDLRKRRDFRNLVEVEAAQDIAADVTKLAQGNAQLAFTARCADDEGISIFERISGDGKITPEEMPEFRQALAHIRRSRDLDHQLSDTAAI